MSEKRRDKKGRILRNGESQRADGRYVYVYVDAHGKQKFIYSWKLEETDKVPQGKRNCASLRSKEKEVKKNLEDGISDRGGEMTVLQLVEKYTGQKRNSVRRSTQVGYDYIIQILQNDPFGGKRIDRVKMSDVKEWYVKLRDSNGLCYNSIRTVKGVLRPAFQMATDDDLIRKNPFSVMVSTVIKDDSVGRSALTYEQEKEFLSFIENHGIFSRYYDAIYILFHTGLRISEFCGLLESDIDFETRRIKVDHQLLKRSVDGHMKCYINETKTFNGVRYVPMTDQVMECFKRIIEKNKKFNKDNCVDGRRGFVILNSKGNLVLAQDWSEYFRNICKCYNVKHENAPLKVTPHICRHTFCSRMAINGMNPKTLQYIMGHSNIGVTMNIYTHINCDDAQREMDRIVNAKPEFTNEFTKNQVKDMPN